MKIKQAMVFVLLVAEMNSAIPLVCFVLNRFLPILYFYFVRTTVNEFTGNDT